MVLVGWKRIDGQTTTAKVSAHHFCDISCAMALKKSCEFDTEQFIMEIQKRSSLWDLSSEDFSNRVLKKKHWEELVEIFGDEELNDEEKRKLGN